MKFFEKGDLTIYHDDITKIQDIPECSIDLTVTSPPYNVDMPYDTHDDKMPYEDYLAWSFDWFSKVFELSKNDGRFCLNIPMETSKQGTTKTFGPDLIRIAKKAGWQYKTTIIWDKIFVNSRMARGTFMEARAPNVVGPYEIIAVFYKEKWAKNYKLKSDLTKEEYLELSEGVWHFRGRHNPKHPAIFPLELPRRCIKMFSYIGDTVLEPFLGSGTTLIAASRLNRKAIGTDISERYCKVAKRWIKMSTREGKKILFEQAGIKSDGISNQETVNQMRKARRDNRKVVKGIKKFLK